ncbi:MAG: SCO6745 family protein [Catenulispora sp.]
MTADPTNDPAAGRPGNPADNPAAIRERALSTAVEAKDALFALGGDYMSSQAARTAAKDLAMEGWPFYFGGRVGVLGPVEPEVVHAIIGFFPAEHVVAGWTVARDPRQSPPLDRIVDRYRDLQRKWADEFLAALPEAEAHELADLLRDIATTSETGLSPLAAAWGAMPEPASARHRVVHWSHVMREQRGGLHITAVQMAGLNPLEAIVTGPQGVGGAKFLRWPEPYPQPDDAMRLFREEAEEITDELASRSYRGLSEARAERLIGLLNQARKAAGGF